MNMAALTLGGEGVHAAISGQSSVRPQKDSPSAKPQFMSSMSELRGGLTETQRQHAARQREQLQRDLEEQVTDMSRERQHQLPWSIACAACFQGDALTVGFISLMLGTGKESCDGC